MYNNAFFIPSYMSSMPNLMQGANGVRGLGAINPLLKSGAGRGVGLFGKLGNNFSLFRSINWSGLINGASKTLGVVNQAIPLVRQVGPVMNNMRSMLKVASVFKDETDKNPIRNSNKVINNTSYNSSNTKTLDALNDNYQSNNDYYENNYIDNTSPTFFI